MVSVSVFQCTCTCLQYLPEQQCRKEEGPTLHSLEVKLYLSHGLQPGPLSAARQQRPNAGPFNPYPCLFAPLNPAWSNSTPRHNCFNSSTTINHTPSTQRPQKIAYPKSKSFLAVSLVQDQQTSFGLQYLSVLMVNLRFFPRSRQLHTQFLNCRTPKMSSIPFCLKIVLFVFISFYRYIVTIFCTYFQQHIGYVFSCLRTTHCFTIVESLDFIPISTVLTKRAL